MCFKKKTETDKAEGATKKAESRVKKEKSRMCCCICEEKIINKYLDAIEKVPYEPHFSEERTFGECQYLPFSNLGVTRKRVIIKNIRRNRIIRYDKVDHCEKLYRCFIESYHAKTKRWITIVLIFVTTIVLCGTVALCAFGPNFKSQGNVNASSAGTAFESEYKGRGVYGYTYFQETGDGRR